MMPAMQSTLSTVRTAARTHGLALAACFACAALAGCLLEAPIAPHDTVVHAPHPDRADASLDAKSLAEAYTASPDTNPDGLGDMNFIWEQSYATLLVWPFGQKVEDLAGKAYARTEQEQRQALAATKLLFEDYVVFFTFLIGDFAELLDLNYFKPEGIYLVNDQGEKYYPFFAETGAWDVPQLGRVTGDFGTSRLSHGFIVFPGQALRSDTKSVSLYLARPSERIRFTWVFDASYQGPEAGGAKSPRHWSVR